MGYGRCTSIDELLAGRRRARDLIERYGLEQLMEAIAAGQDTHPDAITFTGRGPTWSKHLLDRVVAEHGAGSERILVLDLHTAVGPPGESVVLHPYPPGSATFDTIARCIGEVWPNPEQLDFYRWLAAVCPGTEVRTLVCEAGTEQLGPADQYIFPLDVWIRRFGDRNDPAAALHLLRYRRFFDPETDDWMTSVHTHFVRRWPGVLALLGADWPPFDPRRHHPVHGGHPAIVGPLPIS